MTEIFDYTTASRLFQIKKVARYVRIYGPERTWLKIKGKHHLKKRFETLPAVKPQAGSVGQVGIIGCGDFAYTTIAHYLTKQYGAVIRGAMDIDIHRAASLYLAYKIGYYTDDAEEIIGDKEISLVYIACNHADHAEYAIRGLAAGKHVHIEKPHVVNREQLEKLRDVMSQSAGKVFLGFNRPKSAFAAAISKALAKQDGAAMFNWFVAGHEIPSDHWYLREEEGSRVLGNLCHWTDMTYNLMKPEDRYPITIFPITSTGFEENTAVGLTFGDGTVASIAFSSKKEPFEGIREVFCAHKGSALITMKDFNWLLIEEGPNKTRRMNFFRDHGHRNNILESYRSAFDPKLKGEEIGYVWETADLFLKTRKALQSGLPITVQGFRPNQA